MPRDHVMWMKVDNLEEDEAIELAILRGRPGIEGQYHSPVRRMPQ